MSAVFSNEPAAVHYSLRLTCGEKTETQPAGQDWNKAVSMANWIMTGYLRDGFVITCNPVVGRWTAYRKRMPLQIVLEIHATYLN